MSDRFEDDFASRIRQRRQQLKLTQQQVAERIEVSPDYICLVELGHRRLELDRIPKLADVLDVDRNSLCRHALAERAPQLYQELFGF